MNLDKVHRAVWQPNLNIYGNDTENVDFRNTCQIVRSLNEQILCINKNYDHMNLFDPATSDQNVAFNDQLEKFSNQLDKFKYVIEQVKILKKTEI